MSADNIMIESAHQGRRLDHFLAEHLRARRPGEGWSRSAVQRLIAAGQITLNGRKTKSSVRLRADDRIEVSAPPARETPLLAEPMALEILYEDDDCLVLNKAPGIAVHPGAGRPGRTLVNGLLYRCPAIGGVGAARRPGIVHRLDKDTSGVMIVAKTPAAFHDLVSQFRERRVGKEYLALVWGRLTGQKGIIDRPIGRHRSDRKRMSGFRPAARRRQAVTEWRAIATYRVGAGRDPWSWVTAVRLQPRTGRTHQLRVHLAERGHAIVGDRLYGRKGRGGAGAPAAARRLLDFPRQALHAERLVLHHPRSGRPMEFYAPMWEDMRRIIAELGPAASHRVMARLEGVDKEVGFS